MIEMTSQDGKKSDIMPRSLLVVAGGLVGPNGTWLMHRRSFEKPHGGLWEFPGGKVESTEIPCEALVRELREELGIHVQTKHCMPAAFAEEMRSDAPQAVVILLYTLRQWEGEPRAIEGEGVGWFTREEMGALDMPPLDRELMAQLFETGK